MKTPEQTEIYVKRLLNEAFSISKQLEDIETSRPMVYAEDLALIYKFNPPSSIKSALTIIKYHLKEKHDIDESAIKQNVRYPYPNDKEVLALIDLKKKHLTYYK